MIRHLDPDQPVYALVTEVGRDYPRVEALASAYLDEVRAVQPEGPHFLGGLSFGGLVAFEVGQQLFDRGQEVGLLALFDTPTPWALPPKPRLRELAGHLANLRRFGTAYVGKSWATGWPASAVAWGCAWTRRWRSSRTRTGCGTCSNRPRPITSWCVPGPDHAVLPGRVRRDERLAVRPLRA